MTDNRPEPRRPARWEAPARRAIDLIVASVGLLELGPLMVVVAVGIRVTSRGPALFCQRRVGVDGKPFTMYKFRTMRMGADDGALRELIARELRGEDTSVDGSCKIDNDPRITRVGAFLRRTSFDELPQLINVLRGDMTLVGPRPCLEWEAQMFPADFTSRFTVQPGITGLWQINGRSTMGTLDMLRLDIDYVRHQSFWTDLSILVRTVPSMLRGDGAR